MDLEGLTLWMYIKPTIKAVHNKLTTITASGLIGARLVHQPVLNIQVYVEDFPFSCTTQISGPGRNVIKNPLKSEESIEA